MFDKSIKIKWYSIIESTESTKKRLGPQMKFKEKSSCVLKSNDRKIGAITVAGLGIKKISFVNILNRSATIWKAPLRPIKVGPIRRWTNASNLRSVKTVKSVNKTTNSDDNKASSYKSLNFPKISI